LKDPYGGESFIEKSLRKRREAASEEVEEKPDAERPEPEKPELEKPQPEVKAVPAIAQESTPVPDDYVPATTWDGLEHIGTLNEWWDQPPTDKDLFVRCVPAL
jgi:hypothetical protein